LKMAFLLSALFFLISCSAEQELDDLDANQKDCRVFRTKYESLKPKNNPIFTAWKIENCKKIGAWE
jgi:hypothetical protein